MAHAPLVLTRRVPGPASRPGPAAVALYEPTVTIRRPDGSCFERLRCANPGTWGDDEWNELLDGALGPQYRPPGR